MIATTRFSVNQPATHHSAGRWLEHYKSVSLQARHARNGSDCTQLYWQYAKHNTARIESNHVLSNPAAYVYGFLIGKCGKFTCTVLVIHFINMNETV